MDFNNYAAKGNQIVNEVASEIGLPNDKARAFRLLRATLHTLRERLPVPVSIQFLAQLPMALKALYVEGWKYRDKPKRMKEVRDFVREVIHQDAPLGHHDFETFKDGENGVRAVFKVLGHHISEGEINTIKLSLPAALHTLWESKEEVYQWDL